MIIAAESHPCWMKAISGQGPKDLGFLATKLVLSRLNQAYKRDSSSDNLRRCVAELIAFFNKNSNLPKVQEDLKKIMER